MSITVKELVRIILLIQHKILLFQCPKLVANKKMQQIVHNYLNGIYERYFVKWYLNSIIHDF